MTKHLLLLGALTGLVSVSACNRVVDLLSTPDGGNGVNPPIDASFPDGDELPADGGFGTIDTGLGPDGLPDAPYALPDASAGALDASFATPVRTRT